MESSREQLLQKAEPKSSLTRMIIYGIPTWLCSAGVATGIPFYTQMFRDAGLLRYACEDPNVTHCQAQSTMIGNVLGGAFAGSWLPIVLCFFYMDKVGARPIAIFGNVCMAIGFFMMRGVLQGSASGMDDQMALPLGLSYCLCLVGAQAMQFAILGFVWDAHKKLSTMFSIGNFIMQTSTLIPTLMQVVMDKWGVPFTTMCLGYGCLCIPVAFLMNVIVPSQKEYFSLASECLGVTIEPDKSMTMCTRIRTTAGYLNTHKFKMASYIVIVSYDALYFLAYQAELAPYATVILGQETSDSLVQANAYFASPFAGVAAIWCGYLADKQGPALLFKVLVVVAVLTQILLGMKTWAAQLSLAVLMTFNWNVVITLLGRVVLLHVPPAYITTYYSIVMTVGAHSALWFTAITATVSQFPSDSVTGYLLVMRVTGLAFFVTALYSTWYTSKNPLPTAPPAHMEFQE